MRSFGFLPILPFPGHAFVAGCHTSLLPELEHSLQIQQAHVLSTLDARDAALTGRRSTLEAYYKGKYCDSRASRLARA